MFDDYLTKNNVIITSNDNDSNAELGLEDNPNTMEDETEILRHLYKPHERLGFGTLALFRSMRFLAIVTAFMALFMFIAGIGNYKSFTVSRNEGMSILDRLSIANIIFSQPVCIQTYIGMNETRPLDCNAGLNASIIYDLYSTGIVPANTSHDMMA